MTKYKSYTGIGARDTSESVLKLFTSVATYLAKNYYTLRSGGAIGADSAFERGCNKIIGKKEIYLPWRGFSNSDSSFIVSQNEAYKIAEKYHPAWNRLSPVVKKLMARNSHQILGLDLKTPTDFVICFTKGGAVVGGTAQALRIAMDYNIPVFNAGLYKSIEVTREELKLFFIKNTNLKL